MTADRDRQLKRLTELIHKSSAVTTPEAAEYLLDNGVTVEVPEPVIAPGTTGWAVVNETPVRGFVSKGIDEGVQEFYFVAHSGYQSRCPLAYVTDFVPDPEPLTAEAVDEIVAQLDTPRAPTRDQVRHVLAPYVAKGGPR